MGREVVFITAERDGWTLVHDGKRLGPYPTEKDALSTAQLWAEGARRQGTILEFVFESEITAQALVDSPSNNDGRETDQNSRV